MARVRNGARLTSALTLGLALAACGPSEPATSAPTGETAAASIPADAYAFSFQLSLDDATKAKLSEMGEKVTVSVNYYGEPTAAAAPKYADLEPAVVDLGEEVITVGPEDQTISLLGKTVNTTLLGDLEGPVKANINIFTARTAAPDNLISCPLIDDAVEALKAGTAASACTLIYP